MEMKGEYAFTILVVVLVIFVGSVISFSFYSDYKVEKNKCLIHNQEYGFVTEFATNFSDYLFNEDHYHCKIVMDDGSKIRLSDFKIAAVKKPMKKK